MWLASNNMSRKGRAPDRVDSATPRQSPFSGTHGGNARPSVANFDIRESFDNIYLNLSKEPGKCRLAESGLGWKPSGGQTFTLDKQELVSAQWSRAAKAYEIRIFSRSNGVVQLDGFKQDVRACVRMRTGLWS